MDLSYLGHVDETEQPAQLDVGSGFLVGFALGPAAGGFGQFHKACRQRPFAAARLDIALAQQHAPVVRHGQGADHIERVFIVDGVAGRANGTFACVPIVRNAVGDCGAAFAAELDGAAKNHSATISKSGRRRRPDMCK